LARKSRLIGIAANGNHRLLDQRSAAKMKALIVRPNESFWQELREHSRLEVNPMSHLLVLHIDDEAIMRDIVEMSLERDPDLTVQGCESGDEGLAAAAQWPPDIILLDVIMPAMDGPTMLGKLRENPLTADIPVLFMTAQVQKREIDRLMSLGAVGVIAKPFEPLSLAKLVRGYVPTGSIERCREGA
jgi:two-component system OmpR family response regulator